MYVELNHFELNKQHTFVLTLTLPVVMIQQIITNNFVRSGEIVQNVIMLQTILNGPQNIMVTNPSIISEHCRP